MTDIRKREGRKGVTYQVRFQGANGYEYKSFDTYKEARAFREDSAGQRRAASAAAADIKTVAQGVEKWLRICEKEGRNGREPVTRYTLDNYEYRAAIINEYEWSKGLTDLVKSDVVQFRSWLLENHSRSVAHKVLTSFRSMIKDMIDLGIVAHDVAAGVHINATSRYNEPVNVPSEKEIRDLLAAADRLANSKNEQHRKPWQRYRPMLYLAVDSGMRPQEYLVVPRSNIKERGVEVDRALDGSGTEITVTKTRAGRRFVDLNEQTLDMVRHYVKHHVSDTPWDLAFPGEDGGWQSRRNWQRRGFGRACEEAGLGAERVDRNGETVFKPKYTPYDLRHFYASMLIDQRVNLKRIQTLMGHQNIETTLNVYGHLIERAEAASQSRVSVLTCLACPISI